MVLSIIAGNNVAGRRTKKRNNQVCSDNVAGGKG
jgi:hypothetical protein